MAWTEEDPAEASRWLNPTLAGMIPLASAEARASLAPALGQHFKRFVSPTLALVAPAGMSEQDQRAWLATAAETLRGIPADLLDQGCTKARQTCDHPSKIVAAIFAEVGPLWNARKRQAARLMELETIARHRPAPGAGDPLVRPDEVAAIREEFGLSSTDPEGVAARAHTGPAREPRPFDLDDVAELIGIDRKARAEGPAADIAGLTIAEIFARREARRAGQSDVDQAA